MHADPDDVGDYLISARSFDDYRAMFALTGSDLRGSVLDCPGGGSSFTALANQAGASAIAADPAYAQPRDSLAALVMADLQRGCAHTAASVKLVRPRPAPCRTQRLRAQLDPARATAQAGSDEETRQQQSHPQPGGRQSSHRVN